MTNLTLENIAQVCNGKLNNWNSNDRREAQGVVLDSRLVQKDFIFIATVGERVDGHNFIHEVFEQGALAVICEKAPDTPNGPYILVENSLTALKSLAKWYRMQLNIKVVGITGSVGKTTTKEFISSVLSKKYRVLKTEGNYNNEIGLPLTILKIRDYHQVAVLEMGISEFGEMHRLSEIAKPDICVITNIGQCHLENLGSREGVLKAKTEIFDFMSKDGRVVLNGDDDMLATIEEANGKSPIKFTLHPSLADKEEENSYSLEEIYASDIRALGLSGSACNIHVGRESFSVSIPLPGKHMIWNALAATAVGTLLEMNSQEIADGIQTVETLSGRNHIIKHPKYTIIDDCYNANPNSMKAAIDLLNISDTRKVAILGDMFELGKDENTLHQEVGTYAASKNLDLIVCVGKLSSHMYDGAARVLEKSRRAYESQLSHQTSFEDENQNRNRNLLYFETREELLEALFSIIKENDTILVKASNGMGFNQVVKQLIE